MIQVIYIILKLLSKRYEGDLMAKENLKIMIELDKQAERYFNSFPTKLVKARKEVVETAGKIWADETKSITREEDHIDTGLYVNSIGYATGSPNDPQWDLKESGSKTVLTAGTGSSVSYAAALETRYNLMARGLDRAKPRFEKVLGNVVKKNLEL